MCLGKGTALRTQQTRAVVTSGPHRHPSAVAPRTASFMLDFRNHGASQRRVAVWAARTPWRSPAARSLGKVIYTALSFPTVSPAASHAAVCDIALAHGPLARGGRLTQRTNHPDASTQTYAQNQPSGTDTILVFVEAPKRTREARPCSNGIARREDPGKGCCCRDAAS